MVLVRLAPAHPPKERSGGLLFRPGLTNSLAPAITILMWVFTGISLVNITDAQEISVERENASDRLTVFSVAADFGERARVSLARVEMVFSASLVVSLDAGAAETSLSPRGRAERQAQAECAACLNALADALAAGQAFCDLSGLYTPVMMADGEG